MTVFGKIGDDEKQYQLRIAGVKDFKELETSKKMLASAEIS